MICSKLRKIKYFRFFHYLIPFWKTEALVLFLSVITVILSLANPYLTKLIIDRAYGNKDIRLFIFLVAISAIIFIVSGILNGVIQYLNRYLKVHIMFEFNREVFKKIQDRSYAFFQDIPTGQHLYKIGYDIDRVASFISDVVTQVIILFFRSLFILVIVLYLNWRMTVLALVLFPFLYLSRHYFANKMRKGFQVWMESLQHTFELLQEIFVHIKLIKVFGKERYEKKRYIMSLVKNIRLGLKNTKLEACSSFVNNLASQTILGLVVFYGGYQLIKGKLTLGELTAITIYFGQLSGIQFLFTNFLNQASSAIVSFERLERMLNSEATFEKNTCTQEVIFSRGRIEFRNVTFSYGFDTKILDDLTFCIEGGSCIALSGFSGCGKTTLTHLILRLYKLNKGEILIDGHNIENMKSKALYEQIGIVLQESLLWNDTIENNIRYGKTSASLQEVVEAARIACIDDFVNTLSEKYSTLIGENACRLSEGQKQRIAIARALIKRPRILILDEALSSVDSAIESKIINNIRNNFNNVTIILISHHLSTISKMDLVYFLVDSKTINIDAHARLLERSEQYKKYLDWHLKL